MATRGGDYGDCLAVMLGVNGNFSADPEFCGGDIEPYDLSLCCSSPCLPGSNPYRTPCGLVGALGEGCTCGASRVRPTTWGGIKALYR
jgi:hypothetical protein